MISQTVRLPRYILAKDLGSALEYFKDGLTEQVRAEYNWTYGDEESILKHPTKYPSFEYKGVILPCFEKNNNFTKIWESHNKILGEFIPSDSDCDKSNELEQYFGDDDGDDSEYGETDELLYNRVIVNP